MHVVKGTSTFSIHIPGPKGKRELPPVRSISQRSDPDGQSSGLDVGYGLDLQKVLRVDPQLFLQRYSMGPLLPPGFPEEGAEL